MSLAGTIEHREAGGLLDSRHDSIMAQKAAMVAFLTKLNSFFWDPNP
jgi:hypothetical protein